MSIATRAVPALTRPSISPFEVSFAGPLDWMPRDSAQPEGPLERRPLVNLPVLPTESKVLYLAISYNFVENSTFHHLASPSLMNESNAQRGTTWRRYPGH